MINQRHQTIQLGDVARMFSGRRLSLARQVAGLRKNALADRISKSPTAIAAYENGTKKPATSTVAHLSLALGVEPSFFLAGGGDTVQLSTPHFRSLRTTTQVVRDQAFAYGALVHEIAACFERHVELPLLNVPHCAVSPDDDFTDGPEEAARLVRSKWDLRGPVGHLVRLVENHGILVVFSPPQSASVDAFSFESNDRHVILLNPIKNDYYRQRYDLAHEIGHLVMHGDAEPGSRIVESQANRFAAEFLMPQSEFLHVLPHRANWRSLQMLKETWGVSLQALLYRSRQLGILAPAAYNSAIITLSARGWKRVEPGVMPAVEQPSVLPRSLELLRDHGFDEDALRHECRVPTSLFLAATSRTPVFDTFTGGMPFGESPDLGNSEGEIIPLFPIPGDLGSETD